MANDARAKKVEETGGNSELKGLSESAIEKENNLTEVELVEPTETFNATNSGGLEKIDETDELDVSNSGTENERSNTQVKSEIHDVDIKESDVNAHPKAIKENDQSTLKQSEDPVENYDDSCKVEESVGKSGLSKKVNLPEGDSVSSFEVILDDCQHHVDNLELPKHESYKLDILPVDTVIPNRNALSSMKQPDEPPQASKSSSSKKPGWMRHAVALLALSSIVLANMNRQAFNQNLVKMMRKIDTGPTSSISSNSSESNDQPPLLDTNVSYPKPVISDLHPGDLSQETTTQDWTSQTLPEIMTESNQTVDDDDTFVWTSEQRGYLQAAFSWGYTPFMIPGGRMSELYGAKWVVFVSGFGSALCCTLSPFLADTDYYLLLASRVIMGLCQTGVSPALYALLTRWLPPDESSVYLPMIKVSVMLGFMLGALVSGLFSWRVTFYFVGLISILWSILWTFMVTSDPGEHRFVSESELIYIREELRKMNKGRKQSTASARKASAPWFRILTNPVVVLFMFTKFTVKLSTDAQTMQIPVYLDEVFHIPKNLNGALNSLNFAIQGIFTGFVAWLAKEMVVKKTWGLNKTGVRRLFQGTCNIGMGIAYILMTFNFGSIHIACCGFLLLSVSCMFGAGGEAVLPVDLSIEYAASIMAIANSTANLSGILLPPMVSYLLTFTEVFGISFGDVSQSARWDLVWWIVGGVVTAGGLAFVCRVEAEIQDFRSPKIIANDDKKQEAIDGQATMIEMKKIEARDDEI